MIGYLRRGRAAVVAEHSLGVDTVEALHGQFTRQKFNVDPRQIPPPRQRRKFLARALGVARPE